MKFGILMHKTTQNIGDDIQTYAAERFLPSVDYYLDREHLNDFIPCNNEPVAVIMSAWYMWEKWNWPPSKYIVPKFVGMHFADHKIAKQDGSPIGTEFLQGIGKDYLKAYEPIGVRDNFTLQTFENLGISSYFSGCVTLTLPKMPVVKSEKEYICVVDLDNSVAEAVKKAVMHTDIEVKVISHFVNYTSGEESWQERRKKVEQLLTLYQNAKCVVTRRLHCALPCLAMDVPVLLVINKTQAMSTRFEPYYDYLHTVSPKDFINGNYEYNLDNPPENNQRHKPISKQLTKQMRDFVNTMKCEQGEWKDYCKTSYTEDEVTSWQNEKMRQALKMWLLRSREIDIENKQQVNLYKQSEKELKAKIKALENENKLIMKENEVLIKDKEQLKKLLKSRPVKIYIKFRNLIRENKIDIK